MLYSSGTTGRPKGVKVPLPGAPLGDGADAVTGLAAAPVRRRRATIVPLPRAAVPRRAAALLPMAVHRLGGTVVVMEHFDPEQYLAPRRAAPGRPSARSVPTMFIRMLKLPDEVRAALRPVVAAGRRARGRAVPGRGQGADDRVVGPDHPRVLRRHRGQRLRLLQQRGLAGPPGHGRRALARRPCTSSARTATRCPPGEAGTVYFEGEAASSFEYHNDPEKTADSRDPKGRGWTTLGDVGYLDEDGFLYLTDRKAYMIITGGVNVYPQEAENVLAMHPKVNDVAVFGVPERRLRRGGQGRRRSRSRWTRPAPSSSAS